MIEISGLKPVLKVQWNIKKTGHQACRILLCRFPLLWKVSESYIQTLVCVYSSVLG